MPGPCLSWTIKKTEHQRINTFELWCWRRLLRVPWITRRSNQSVLQKINPEYSLERLMLKFQYFGHMMFILEKTLMLGKIAGRRERGRQRIKWLNGNINSMGLSFEQTLGDNIGQGSLVPLSPWSCKESYMTEQLNNNNKSQAQN